MKDKIAIYGGIFLTFMELALLTSTFLWRVSLPQLENLETAEGVVSHLYYKNYNKGDLNDLYISLDNNNEKFHISNVSKLKEHNGCYLTTLKEGDTVKIYYASKGYGFMVGEKNDIWRIENNGKVILKETDILSVLHSLNNYYCRQSYLFIFLGALMFVLSVFFPNFWSWINFKK